jgi:hypothetical protein
MKKLANVNHHPMGETLPNLVTLPRRKKTYSSDSSAPGQDD